MLRFLALAALSLLVALPAWPQASRGVPVRAECPAPRAPDYFFPIGGLTDPKGNDEPFLRSWYSAQLAAMGEPSLSCSGAEAMRFTWLRTFHNPVAVRVDWEPSGKVRLTAIEMSGAGGYDPGNRKRHIRRVLPAEDLARLNAALAQENFWGMDLPAEERGWDGAEWILEGRRGEQYRAITAWSPWDGPVRRLGMTFLSLTGWTVEPMY